MSKDIKNLNNPNSTGEVGRQLAKGLFSDGTYDLNIFHDVFIEEEDPTEYAPAMRLVGSWGEWERIKRDWKGFNTHIQNWKEELEVKLKSKAIKQVTSLATDGNFQASKWIAENGWDKRTGAGRPSVSERKRAAKEIASEAAETKDDEQRMLRVLNGGK